MMRRLGIWAIQGIARNGGRRNKCFNYGLKRKPKEQVSEHCVSRPNCGSSPVSFTPLGYSAGFPTHHDVIAMHLMNIDSIADTYTVLLYFKSVNTKKDDPGSAEVVWTMEQITATFL